MSRVPLFTVEELTAAFALIVPPDVAAHRAQHWFEMLSPDDVSESGYFLYEAEDEDEDQEPAILATGVPPTTAAMDSRALAKEQWSALQEHLFLGFGDFHLNLLALVSEDLFRRIQAVNGVTDQVAERNSARTRLMIREIRGGA